MHGYPSAGYVLSHPRRPDRYFCSVCPASQSGVAALQSARTFCAAVKIQSGLHNSARFVLP